MLLNKISPLGRVALVATAQYAPQSRVPCCVCIGKLAGCRMPRAHVPAYREPLFPCKLEPLSLQKKYRARAMAFHPEAAAMNASVRAIVVLCSLADVVQQRHNHNALPVGPSHLQRSAAHSQRVLGKPTVPIVVTVDGRRCIIKAHSIQIQ